jgi:hypothetical protein
MSVEREPGLGIDARQLLRVTDEVQARDETALGLDGHDAVDLAVQAQDEGRVSVGHGGVNGDSGIGLAGAR